jgi:hypothetical protein
MKKLYLTLSAIIAFQLCALAQGGEAIDRLFEKYSGKEGITYVYISSKMFSIFAGQETDDKELSDIMSRLKSIRILTVDDSVLNKKTNFYEELKKGTDFSSYEELMVVSESTGVTKFLIRGDGKKVDELLVISGGSQGNTLISIRGDLDMKNISGLSKQIGIEELGGLEKLDQKQKNK